jgi:nitroreductase
MQAKEAILSRRSCRKYQTKDIPKEVIDDIILAGKSAPTAMNRQEIKFYVIHNNIKKIQSIGAKVMENRAKAGKSGGWMEEYKKKYEVEDVIFYDSPCIIALTADKTGDERADYWHLMDAGIVTGNILTMATNYGLGTVPIGIANFLNQEAVLEGIGADKSKEHLLLVISLGYPVEGYKEKYVEDKPLTSFVKYA